MPAFRRRHVPLLVAGMAMLSCATPEPSRLVETTGPYIPGDSTVRVHDFVVTDEPWLADEIPHLEEISLHRGTHRVEDGETVISIVSSGRYAEQLGRMYGVEVRGHARLMEVLGADDVGVVREALTCSTIPPESDPTFPWYDAHPMAFNGGIDAELQSLHNPTSGVYVHNIGQGAERDMDNQPIGRDIWAVQFGPFDPSEEPVPTLYIFGTYHAREWASTAVALRLTRWLNSIATAGGAVEAAVYNQLAFSSVVVVPVVNPDGYQATREGNREHRKNMAPNTCGVVFGPDGEGIGVDLNRNHSTAFNLPTDTTSTLDCRPVFTGDGLTPALQPETAAVEMILGGGALTGAQRPVAAISLHSFGDQLLYPAGYVPPGGSGPPCSLNEENCMNADFTVYRDVFGDTENPFHSGAFRPMHADQAHRLLYSASGTLGLHGQYGPNPMLSLTTELSNGDWNFYLECDPNHVAVVDSLTNDQQDLVRYLLSVMPTVDQFSPADLATAYVPNQFGQIGAGMLTRDVGGSAEFETARGRFLVAVWGPTDTGVLNAGFGGGTSAFNALREGVHQNLYRLDLPDPVSIPCEIVAWNGASEAGYSAGCTGDVDLSDPGRLPHTGGWDLTFEERGDIPDYHWVWDETTGAVGDTLTLERRDPVDSGTTSCYFSFTMFNDARVSGLLILERETSGGGWEEVMRWPDVGPAAATERLDMGFWPQPPAGRLRTYSYEANSMLPGARPAFRFRVAATPVDGLEIYDPIAFCRTGPIP